MFEPSLMIVVAVIGLIFWLLIFMHDRVRDKYDACVADQEELRKTVKAEREALNKNLELAHETIRSQQETKDSLKARMAILERERNSFSNKLYDAKDQLEEIPELKKQLKTAEREHKKYVSTQEQLYDRLYDELRAAQEKLFEAGTPKKSSGSKFKEWEEHGLLPQEHRSLTSEELKWRLIEIQGKKKELVSDNEAVVSDSPLYIPKYEKEIEILITKVKKLMLRTLNNETELHVQTANLKRVEQNIQRLEKLTQQINDLGFPLGLKVNNEYLLLCQESIKVRAEELKAKEQERLREKEEREILKQKRAEAREKMLEEEKVHKEIEAQRQKLEKEREHYLNALSTLDSNNDDNINSVTVMKAQIESINKELEKVDFRAANTRAGYVYVISNLGAFGPGVVKIGMTRRLEPMDRVKELGDASVPFRFDTHALIFSDDAVALETSLHSKLEERRVNLITRRKEFFYATPSMVKEIISEIDDAHLVDYKETFEANDWRLSGERSYKDYIPAEIIEVQLSSSRVEEFKD